MTTPTVADALAWSALPEDAREQYRRALRDELWQEFLDEDGGFEAGRLDGRADRDGDLAGYIENAHHALAAKPPRVREAQDLVAWLYAEVIG